MRRMLAVLTLIGSAALLSTVLDAAKPPPPPPPPPPPAATGIIFHLRNGVPYAVRPDDTGLTTVSGADPNFYAEGSNPFHDRWHLTVLENGIYDEVIYNGQTLYDKPHYDLFAYRSVPGNPSQIEYVQLTDTFGKFKVVNTSAWHGFSADSNEDAAHSFVVVDGYDIRGTFTDIDGVTRYDHNDAQQHEHHLRLPLTATALTVGWQNDNFPPYTGVDLDDFLYPPILGQMLPAAVNGQYLYFTFSGNKAILVDPITLDVNNPVSVVWNGNTEPSNLGTDWQNNVPSVSPDGTKVGVINNYTDSRGGVWILSLDGSSAPKQIAHNASGGSSSTKFSGVFFSPDSKHIITQRATYKSRTWTFDQIIYPAAGGAAVKTFANSPMAVTRWVSANTAP